MTLSNLAIFDTSVKMVSDMDTDTNVDINVETNTDMDTDTMRQIRL
jgi:hypothetical protein